MTINRRSRVEAVLAAKYSAVACLGFATDAILLKLGIHFGLSSAAARAASLPLAMQATFWVNGAIVFRCLELRRLPQHWLGYMASNGLGNTCNFLVFVGMVSMHHPLLSRPLIALAVGALTAWSINYASLRLVVFGAAQPGKPAERDTAEPNWCGPFETRVADRPRAAATSTGR